MPGAFADSIVVMGVSGCGKSSVGAALAQALHRPFIEGDDWHAPENVARMAAGIALTDADRQGWLQALSERLGQAGADGRPVVLACSALKRSYRDLLRQRAPGLLLVHLSADRSLLAQRLLQRAGHYMPPALLDSQLEALEPPGPGENVLCFDVRAAVPSVVDQVLIALGSMPTGGGKCPLRNPP
jgi:gluconokinase